MAEAFFKYTEIKIKTENSHTKSKERKTKVLHEQIFNVFTSHL